MSHTPNPNLHPLDDTLPDDGFHRTPQGKQLLKTMIWNGILISILVSIFTLLYLTDFLFEAFALIGVCLIATYVLLGPVNALARGFETLANRFQDQFFQLPLLPYRSLAVLTTYILVLLVTVLTTIQVLPSVVQQIQELQRDLPHYYHQGVNRLNDLSRSMQSFNWVLTTIELDTIAVDEGSTEEPTTALPQESGSASDVAPAAEAVSPGVDGETTDVTASNSDASSQLPNGWGEFLSDFVSLVKNLGSTLLGSILNLGTITLTGIIYGLTALVLIFYLLSDGPFIKRGAVRMFPEPWQPSINNFLEHTHIILYRFLQGQIVLGALAGLSMFILLFILDVKFNGLLSFGYGLSSIVPVIGPWVGLIPILLVVLVTQPWWATILLLLATGAFYLFKEHVLLPQLLPRTLNIHPLTVILSYLVCTRIAGPVGLLLAFPLAALIAVVFQYITQWQNREIEMAPIPSPS